jgi:hypothetical protein
MAILTSPQGYQLTLTNAPPLAVEFLTHHWGRGLTAAAARRLLVDHGYVVPAYAGDRLTGRALGVQSTLQNWGELTW